MTDEAQAREGLEPCPFCGGMATIRQWLGHSVGCSACKASTAVYVGGESLAIAAWNRRASPTPPAPSADLEARARGIFFDVASTNTFAPTDIPEREAILSERTALRAMLALAAEVRADDRDVGDATVLRAYCRIHGETPSMTHGNREHWKFRAEKAEAALGAAEVRAEGGVPAGDEARAVSVVLAQRAFSSVEAAVASVRSLSSAATWFSADSDHALHEGDLEILLAELRGSLMGSAAPPPPEPTPDAIAQAVAAERERILNIEMVPATSPYRGYDEGWDAAVKAYRAAIRAAAPTAGGAA